MCTVTYRPGPAGFILTHNRDEAPSRSPQQLVKQNLGFETAVFPRDTRAGGTWIGVTRSGRTACLLNGAFVKHERNPPYRKSRGLILLDFLGTADVEGFFETYDLTDIEPFTMLFFEAGRGVTDFRWDGSTRHRRLLSHDAPYIWSSATLYTPELQKLRENLFYSRINAIPARTAGAGLLNLHRTGSVGDPENDYVMNRNNVVRTVSITQIRFQSARVQIQYLDLIHEQTDSRELSLVNLL